MLLASAWMAAGVAFAFLGVRDAGEGLVCGVGVCRGRCWNFDGAIGVGRGPSEGVRGPGGGEGDLGRPRR